MVHLPCNLKFSKCPKKKDGKCAKGYPKEFQNNTQFGKNSYPLYKRRKGIIATKYYGSNSVLIDNRNIVPHNSYLLIKFNAHINLEICTDILAVKYLYKYIYKGFDKAIIDTDMNECRKYYSSRYVSSIEACWKLKGFPMHGRLPAVVRLPVHTEMDQVVYFKENENVKDIISKPIKSLLISWFNLNKLKSEKLPFLKDIVYYDLPIYCTLRNKEWNLRQRNITVKKCTRNKKNEKNEIKKYEDIVSRSYFVPIKESERFYLSKILYLIKGCKNFQDTKKWNGKEYITYRELTSDLGLLDDDKIWYQTLDEAILINCNANKLRRIFAQMLIYCEINNPIKLWNTYKNQLSDDIRRKNKGFTEEEYNNKALIQIEKFLSLYDQKLSNYNLPSININSTIDYNQLNIISNEDFTEFLEELNKLSNEQRYIYNIVEEELNNRKNITSKKSSKVFFIHAAAGSGKTFTLNTIIKGMNIKNYKIISVAYSGIAAILLRNGRTAHSFFKIPINIQEDEEIYCNISKNSKLAEYIKIVDLIIFDEATMASSLLFNCLDRTLKDLCENNLPFGNKVMVLSGDFRQTLPIIKHAKKEDIIRNTIKQCFFLEFNYNA
jgi:hypothetical protein